MKVLCLLIVPRGEEKEKYPPIEVFSFDRTLSRPLVAEGQRENSREDPVLFSLTDTPFGNVQGAPRDEEWGKTLLN